jgi:hypothetical protein
MGHGSTPEESTRHGRLPLAVTYRVRYILLMKTTTSPNATPISPVTLADLIDTLEHHPIAEGAAILRGIGHAYPERTEWPYHPYSATADNPGNHAAYLLRHPTREEAALMAKLYRDYRWDVAAA